MSNIEWTDATWNPTVGCAKVADGCKHCYAENMSKRLAAMGQTAYAEILDDQGRFNGKAITRPNTLDKPLRWRKPRTVFVNSMSDLFHKDVPFEFIDKVYAVMLACAVLNNRPHTFQILTKRPERMLEYFNHRMPRDHVKAWAEAGDGLVELDNKDILFSEMVRGHTSLPWDEKGEALFGETPHPWTHLKTTFPLPNVWHGVSVAEQKDADKFILPMLNTPSAIHFVSYEPAVGPVDFRNIRLPGTGSEKGKEAILDALGGWLHTENDTWPQGAKIDWLIIGGESGPGARPFDVAWARAALKQCAAVDFLKTERTPVFVKQLGAYPEDAGTSYRVTGKGGHINEIPEDLRVREFPERTSP